MSVDEHDYFISGDWGTSRLRLRLVEAGSLETIAEVESDGGISAAFRAWQAAGSPSDREGFYLRGLAPEVDRVRAASGVDPAGLTLVLSGMASATIGLRELPYAPAPFDLSRAPLPMAWVDPGVLPCRALLVSGVRTEDDVMRGEETILVGLAAGGLRDGLVILPGTHSKHAVVRGGVLERFHTYLTGELFAIIREHSVLRPMLSTAPAPGDAFIRGVRDAGESNLLHELFRLRARSVLQGTSAEENANRLSGLLIGLELLGLTAEAVADLPISIAASEPLLSFYRSALRALGLEARCRTIPPEETRLAVARGQRVVLQGR